MANIQAVSVAKIIEGALNGDLEKVIAYGNHIAKDLNRQGDYIAFNVILDAVDQRENENIVTLDGD